jgi:hypothetical protein
MEYISTSEVQPTSKENGEVAPPEPSVYAYLSLPTTTSFRVLELLSGELVDEVTIRLRIEDWDKPPPYEAISYAWGTDEKVAVMCDGCILPVTPNLKDGLRRMRYTNHSRFLWADAACIDQTNNQERGQQVSNMRKIYARATKVLVWLGEDPDLQGPTAIAAMHDLASACCKDRGWTFDQLKDCDDIYSMLRAVRGPKHLNITAADWHCICWFLSRPWLTRLWVWQEVNSGTEVNMLCGACEVSWEVVSLCATYVRMYFSIYKDRGLSRSHFNNAYIMRDRAFHNDLKLPELLHWGRKFTTSDPLDRVYALMCMPPFTRMGSWRADYRKSVFELYRDVAERCILGDGDLTFLWHVQHDAEVQENMPTWVPQWDQPFMKNPIESSIDFTWHAGGKTRVSATVNGSILRIGGIVVDTIKTESQVDYASWFDSQHDYMDDHPILKFWLSQRSLPSHYLTGEPSLEVYAMIFPCGFDYSGAKAVENREKFMARFAAFVIWLLENSKQTMEQYPELIEQARPGDASLYVNVARRSTWNRSFFTTKKGYMALARTLCILETSFAFSLVGRSLSFYDRRMDSIIL